MLQDIQEIVQIVKKNREKKRSGVSTDLIRE
jgi:hypothetical protein